MVSIVDVTEPTGRNFISYRRLRQEDIGMLLASQHEHGIPTWQDLRNLGEGPTEDQITAVLADPTTASATLWLTPEVAQSSFIKKVEVPRIISRFDAHDEFFVVTVAAGGLDYDSAADAIQVHSGLHDVSKWNIIRVAEPIEPDHARAVTERTLRSRIGAVHRTALEDDPLRVRIHIRQPPPFEIGYALSLDWSHVFEGRHSSSWHDRLLPALSSAVGTIQQTAPGRRIVASGLPTITAALALGVACLEPRLVDVSWSQHTQGKGEQEWSLQDRAEPCGFSQHRTSGSTDSDELAVLVSVADDVAPAFAASRPHLPAFRAVLSIARDGTPLHTLESSGEAVDLVQLIVRAIREARRALRLLGGVHLFLAVPVGVAMMLGQSLNTLGEVHAYEYVALGGVGQYSRELTIRPSDQWDGLGPI